MPQFCAVSIVLLLSLSAALAAWIVLLRRQAQERMRQRDAAFHLVHRVGDSLATSLALDPALKISIDYVIHSTHAESGAIFLLDESRLHLKARIVRGFFPLKLDSTPAPRWRKQLIDRLKATRIALGHGLIGQIAAAQKPLLIRHVPSDPRYASYAELAAIKTLMAAPLMVRGQLLGVMAVAGKRAGQAFDEQDLRLLQALAEEAAVVADLVTLANEAAEQHRLHQELRLAHEFQQLLLPKECPVLPGMELAAYCKSALEIGGDFYDFIPLEGGRLGIAVADAEGKGITGALIMAATRSALRSEARRSDSPREVLHRVNEQVVQDTKTSVFITMIYGILDPAAATFCFARAGHEPLLLCGADGALPQVIEPEGMALGLVGADLFDLIDEETLRLNQGQALVLFTDGAVEAQNEAGEEYGLERLKIILSQTAPLPCPERLRQVVGDIAAFVRTAPQHDDLTLVAVGVTGQR